MSLYVAGLYVAGLIGAGFASGTELAFFFVNYGWGGFFGILLTFSVLTGGGILALEYCGRHELTSYRGLFAVLGRRAGAIFAWIYTVFLLMGTAVMLAGIGAMAPSPAGQTLLRLASAFLIIIALQEGVAGVLQISGWLAPPLVILLIILAGRRLLFFPPHRFNAGSWRGLEAGLLYASYNFGFSLAVLASTHQLLRSKAQRWGALLAGNLLLGLTMLVVVLSLGSLSPLELASPFPLQCLAASWSPLALKTYQVLLWSSMYTTALANSLALLKRLTAVTGLSWSKAAPILVLGPVALSYCGFSNLIQMAYPLLGLAGLYLLLHLVRASFLEVWVH